MAVGKVATGAIAWRYDGQLQVTAIVKATFAFAPEGVMPLVEPQEIFAEEVRHGRNPARSVRFASDLVPRQRRVDVHFTGKAHAPANASVTSMHVRLGLFDGQRMLIDKPLVVRKNSAFRSMAMTYENAFGGIGYPDNPYGCGMDAEDEPPTIIDPVHPRQVGGYGPISRTAGTRKRLLGSAPVPNFAAGIATLPTSINWEYFQSAPEDQRVHALRGDEQIMLEGLHPQLSQLHLRLPGVRGLARIHGLDKFGVADGTMLPMYATTLHISGDEERCMVTFRASFPLASDEALAGLLITAGVERPGEALEWPDPSLLGLMGGPSKPKRTTALILTSDATMMLDEDDVEILDDDEAPAEPVGISDETSYLSDSHVRVVPNKALPFQHARGDVAASLPVSPPRAPAPDAGNTLFFDTDEPLPAAPAVVAPAPVAPAFVPVAPPPVVAPPPPLTFVAPTEPAVPPPAVVMAAPAPVAPAAPTGPIWAESPAAPAAPAPPKRQRPVAPPKFDARAKLYGARIKPR